MTTPKMLFLVIFFTRWVLQDTGILKLLVKLFVGYGKAKNHVLASLLLGVFEGEPPLIQPYI